MFDWFYVNVGIVRTSGALPTHSRRVPRVRFFAGYDYAYMDMRLLAVYWSPRSPCSEGEELYDHYIKFNWRPLFHFNWR